MTVMANEKFRDFVQTSDVEQVRDLVIKTGFFNSAECNIAAELVSENLTRGALVSGYYFWFLECGAELLGYSCYGPIDGTESSYDLYWIAVAKNRQGQGYGQKILLQTETSIAAQGGERVYIETAQKPLYQPTRKFYERADYQQVALLPDFYAPGDGKLIYCKRLSAL